MGDSEEKKEEGEGGGGGGGGEGQPAAEGGGGEAKPGPTVQMAGVEGEEEDEEQKIFRMDISLSYTKERREMGRPYSHFSGVGPVTIIERRPDPNNRNFVRPEPEPVGCQTEVHLSEHKQVTDKKAYSLSAMAHTSGGWPKEINDYDTDAVTRWRKKMIKGDELNAALPKFYELVERCLIQNNSLDLYERYFQPPAWSVPEHYTRPRISPLCHFPDQSKSNVRPVQQVDIEPFDGVEAVGAYAHLTYMRRDFSVETENYIWDITRLPEPVRVVDATVPAVKLQYNPKLPKVILGGLITGQLCYWDVRADKKPVAYTDLYNSFRDPPSGLLWLHSKQGWDCFASSSDGQIVWYDIRKFDEPLDKLVLDFNQDTSAKSSPIGISTLEFEPTIQTKFMVGTETGQVYVGNRKGKTLKEKMSDPYYAFSTPVRSLSRNPSYMKCFLCVGDYSFRILAEDCKESYIYWSNPSNAWLTAGKWSDSRSSTFFVTKSDGTLDLWDLMMNVDRPVASEVVSEKALRCLAVHKNGRLVLTGGDSGVISLYELSTHFYHQDKNEKSATIAFFDRESKREKFIDARNREVKLLQKQRPRASSVQGDDLDKMREKIENDYNKLLQEYDTKLLKLAKGIVDDDDYK